MLTKDRLLFEVLSVFVGRLSTQSGHKAVCSSKLPDQPECPTSAFEESPHSSKTEVILKMRIISTFQGEKLKDNMCENV
jgi:hypothetical protein